MSEMPPNNSIIDVYQQLTGKFQLTSSDIDLYVEALENGTPTFDTETINFNLFLKFLDLAEQCGFDNISAIKNQALQNGFTPIINLALVTYLANYAVESYLYKEKIINGLNLYVAKPNLNMDLGDSLLEWNLSIQEYNAAELLFKQIVLMRGEEELSQDLLERIKFGLRLTSDNFRIPFSSFSEDNTKLAYLTICRVRMASSVKDGMERLKNAHLSFKDESFPEVINARPYFTQSFRLYDEKIFDLMSFVEGMAALTGSHVGHRVRYTELVPPLKNISTTQLELIKNPIIDFLGQDIYDLIHKSLAA